MAPPMTKPAALAAFGRLSPSSQAAWCGSPQAICTRLMPSLSMNPFSSGTDLTCNDQLQTPTSSGLVAMVSLRIAVCQSGPRSGRRFDPAAERPQVRVLALLVKRAQLVELQLGNFLRPGPDHGLAGFVGGHHQVDGPRLVVPEHLAQDQDHEHLGVMVVVLDDHVIRREQPR